MKKDYNKLVGSVFIREKTKEFYCVARCHDAKPVLVSLLDGNRYSDENDIFEGDQDEFKFVGFLSDFHRDMLENHSNVQ